MFDQKKLDRSFNQTRGIFDTYIYKSDTDDSVTIKSAGYFIESRYINTVDWIGSEIRVQATDGTFTGVIGSDGTVSASPEVGFVTSVFGRGGNVLAVSGDYDTDQVTEALNLYFTEARVQAVPEVAGAEQTTNKGVANGYAGLDGSGAVPTTQLPASVLGEADYKGLWNAATNTPTLANGVGANGYFYRCNVAGSVDFGAGSISFQIGQSAIYDGSSALWQKIGIEASDYLSKATYDPTNVAGDAFSMGNMAETATAKIFSDTERTKLTDIEAGAEVNQTDAEIKVQYEANADTNAFTDAEQTKLTGIAANAEVNVNADWNAVGGDEEILNKPSDVTDLSLHAVAELSDVSSVGSGDIITVSERNKLAGIEALAQVNAVDDVNGQTGSISVNQTIFSTYVVGSTVDPSTTADSSGTAPTLAQMTHTFTPNDTSNEIEVFFGGSFINTDKKEAASCAVFIDGTIQDGTTRTQKVGDDAEEVGSLSTFWKGSLSAASHTITIGFWGTDGTTTSVDINRNFSVEEIKKP